MQHMPKLPSYTYNFCSCCDVKLLIPSNGFLIYIKSCGWKIQKIKKNTLTNTVPTKCGNEAQALA